MNRRTPPLAALIAPSLGLALAAQAPVDLDKPIETTRCRSRVAIEFIAPTATEEVEVPRRSPNPDA
jgi:hypothetical protein